MDRLLKMMQIRKIEQTQNLGEVDFYDVLLDPALCERIRIKHNLCEPDETVPGIIRCSLCGKEKACHQKRDS